MGGSKRLELLDRLQTLLCGRWRFSLSLLKQFLSNRSQYAGLMVVGANWLMWCQECLRALFWDLSCSLCTPGSFSPY